MRWQLWAHTAPSRCVAHMCLFPWLTRTHVWHWHTCTQGSTCTARPHSTLRSCCQHAQLLHTQRTKALHAASKASLLGKRGLSRCQGWVVCPCTYFPFPGRNEMSSFLFRPSVVLATLMPAGARSSLTFPAVPAGLFAEAAPARHLCSHFTNEMPGF